MVSGKNSNCLRYKSQYPNISGVYHWKNFWNCTALGWCYLIINCLVSISFWIVSTLSNNIFHYLVIAKVWIRSIILELIIFRTFLSGGTMVSLLSVCRSLCLLPAFFQELFIIFLWFLHFSRRLRCWKVRSLF